MTTHLTALESQSSSHRSPSLSGLDGRNLIVVSNREPYRSRDDGASAWRRTTGGLVSAVEPLVRRCDGTWIAWGPEADGAQVDRASIERGDRSITMLRVPVNAEEVERYYRGFSNRTLWPLLHSLVDRCHIDAEDWETYRRVNERFAGVLLDELDDDSVVWIHDYHLLLLPQLLRGRGCTAAIAFFCHVPFPPPEILRLLPWRRSLLIGMLGADLIGFHSRSYARSFVECCRRFLGATVDADGETVRWKARTCRVVASPIGIAVDELEALSLDPSVISRGRELRKHIGADHLVLGVDRLDYTKGIPNRLRAMDLLFESHPELRGRATLVQIAVRSRETIPEYQELKHEVDELVGRINGRWGTSEWQPIRYSSTALDREELVAHYLAADLCLITPLRDGMNLVALEYCACRTEGDGVVALSELAGAADLLDDAALLVNPYSTRETAETIHEALHLTENERRRRMARARARVAQQDVESWLENTLAALAAHDGWIRRIDLCQN